MTVSLDAVEPGSVGRVRDIVGGMGIRLRLEQMGIHPGDVIRIKRKGVLRGPILIESNGTEVALGRGIASRILVEV
ncbi:MAG: ferrous iron transport protein A [Calditrichaeota bacterium]|nr:ferrous iron transport protein A [Calditrichota bacterium]